MQKDVADNHGHSILRTFDVLQISPFPTGETKLFG